MMWQYLVVDYALGGLVGGGEWREWRLPSDSAALSTELGNSLQEGCAALGQLGWELVGVTLAVGGPMNTYTLFFKKPA